MNYSSVRSLRKPLALLGAGLSLFAAQAAFAQTADSATETPKDTVKLDKFRKLVKTEFGDGLKHATPANVREFVDRLEGEVFLEKVTNRIVIDEPCSSYEEVIKDFFFECSNHFWGDQNPFVDENLSSTAVDDRRRSNFV